MLIYRRTSVLESNAQTLVNTVNCVGVMGKGIAKEFRGRFPEMFDRYVQICDSGDLQPGKLWLWKGSTQWVLNFPTKNHWRHPSKLEWIDAGLTKFAQQYALRGITEISFPRLGCGNGGLNWNDVQPLMERHLSGLPIKVFIHDHTVDIGIPEHLRIALGSSRRRSIGSFDAFLKEIGYVVSTVGDRMVDFRTRKPFVIAPHEGGFLLKDNDKQSVVPVESLRGVWIALLTGLAMQQSVASAKADDATQVLSIVGLLDQTRPVEIQKQSSDLPELAVEFLDRSKQAEVDSAENTNQAEFSWH